MPCYEYECAKCGNRFEFLHLGNEVAKCESCGTKKVTRLLSSFGFGFKGFGASSAEPPAPVEAAETENGTDTCCGGGSCGCG
ncbi:MAG: zinc ribbon domain-containing protein [Candidatus Dadabacteria bacterium]|nr:zinc ribbon domain-containing protein [Candidatus Dadabacteria bacterium]